jgi:hypothetical protein
MSLRKSQHQTLSFPGEGARETWLCGADGRCRQAEFSANAKAGVLGIEALALDSAPFWFMKAEGAEQDLKEAVTLRWEALGSSMDEGAMPWAFWPVKETDKHILVGTMAICEELPQVDWAQAAAFEQYEPSARLLPLPSDGLAIWKELGRLVVAITSRKELLHVAVLTSRSLDAEAALEIRDLCQALIAHEFPVPVENVRVWTACDADFVPQMACLFEKAAFQKEPRPDPVLPRETGRLVPAQVAAIRREKQAQVKKLLVYAAVAAVYVIFFGAWWAGLKWRESKLDAVAARLAAEQPEIEIVREAQQNWLDMEPAINPDLYPVEIFHQIVSLLPPEGIRLKEFQMDGDKIVVGGEATSVNHALGFKDKLAACKPLQRYVWNFPVPRIRDDDNRAEFRAIGNVNGGTTNESE